MVKSLIMFFFLQNIVIATLRPGGSPVINSCKFVKQMHQFVETTHVHDIRKLLIHSNIRWRFYGLGDVKKSCPKRNKQKEDSPQDKTRSYGPSK